MRVVRGGRAEWRENRQGERGGTGVGDAWLRAQDGDNGAFSGNLIGAVSHMKEVADPYRLG